VSKDVSDEFKEKKYAKKTEKKDTPGLLSLFGESAEDYSEVIDALKAIDKIPLSTAQRRRISSTISAGKSGISAGTQNVIRTTDPYVEILFRKLLNKFINGKLSHPKLNKYKGLVFYKRTLEKKLGIKI
jgi:hypothetical protein